MFQILQAVWKFENVQLHTKSLADVEAMLWEKHLVESDVSSSESESSSAYKSSDSE